MFTSWPSELVPQSRVSVLLGLVLAVGSLRALRLALDRHHRLAATTKSVIDVHEAPKSPSTLPILDNTLDVLRHNDHLYDWLTEQCLAFEGRPFRIKAFGLTETVMLSHPKHIEEVLKTHVDNFVKGPFIRDVFVDLMGDGIFAADGDAWYHQRKTASHLFTMRALRDSVTNIVHRHIDMLLGRLDATCDAQEPLDLSKELHRLTFHAFAEIGFGVDIMNLPTIDENTLQDAFDGALRHLSYRLLVPRPLWKLQRYWNLGPEATFKRNVEIIHRAAVDVIDSAIKRRASGKVGAPGGADLVSLFLDHTAGDTASYSPTFLRDMVLNILIAGRDTTAQAISWFFLSLSRHPDVEQKIRHELENVLPRGKDKTHLSMDDVQQLAYLDAALKETLRLYPSVPLNMRTTVSDTVLSDGTILRAGSMVGLPTYALGRMPHVWGPDASTFNPDRWFDPATGDPVVVSAFKFNSFHAGPRMCLGQSLAMLEMKIIAASLLTRFHVDVLPGQDITYDRSLTMPIKGPFMVRFRKR